MLYIRILVALISLFVSTHSVFAQPPAPGAEIPKDVRDLDARVALCLHWAQENDEDKPELKKAIAKGAKNSGCDTLQSDAIALVQKYKDNTNVSGFLVSLNEQWQLATGLPLYGATPTPAAP